METVLKVILSAVGGWLPVIDRLFGNVLYIVCLYLYIPRLYSGKCVQFSLTLDKVPGSGKSKQKTIAFAGKTTYGCIYAICELDLARKVSETLCHFALCSGPSSITFFNFFYLFAGLKGLGAFSEAFSLNDFR